MRSHPALLVALLVLPLLGAGAGVGAQQSAHSSVEASVADRTVANETGPNGTTMHVELQRDGDARWNVSIQFVLQGENETKSFEQLGEEYTDDRSNLGPSADKFRRIIRLVEVQRSMAIRNVDKSYRVGNGTGTLSLSFVWTNFTRTNGDRLILRDVFMLDEETTWLSKLGANQRLVIENPDGYRITDSPNLGFSNGTVREKGPRTFEPGEIDVTYQKNRQQTTEPPSGLLSDLPEILLLLLVVGAGGAGLYVLFQRRDDDGVAAERTPPPMESEPPEEATAEPEPGDDERDVELLSDEERVLRLLERNGGRMKQANIVADTNWSNAKVSQLLSAMDDEGTVDKLRIGRENLITLPEEDPTDFEDE